MYVPPEKKFALCPVGNHIAICYQFIDLGTQETSWQGKTTRKHMVSFRWELPLELMEETGMPFSIGRRYNWSMNKKSALRQDLEAWRNRPFTAEDLSSDNPHPFDVKNVLGKPCMLQVVHDETGEYANIAAVAAMPKGMQVPPQVNKSVYFSLQPERFDIATFKSFSEKLQEVIAKSPEYKLLMSGGKQEDLPQSRGHDDLNDEIPF